MPRGGERLKISDPEVEPRRVWTRCGERMPGTARVRVKVTGAQTVSVSLIQAFHDETRAVPMNGSGMTWTAAAGPYNKKGTVRISVLAVSADGQRQHMDLGEVCVSPCDH